MWHDLLDKQGEALLGGSVNRILGDIAIHLGAGLLQHCRQVAPLLQPAIDSLRVQLDREQCVEGRLDCRPIERVDLGKLLVHSHK